jgi:sigma-B regulation protein RsbU (phosphoserine phosphatase)
VSIYSAVKKVEWSRALLLGTLPLWFCVGFDILVHIILKLDDQIYLGAYGFPSMLVTIAFILANRFVSYHNDVEEYKEKLEVMVDERTRQLNDRNRDLEEAHFIMKRDMVMAENVQKSLFPRNIPSADDWDLAYSFKPMAGVSGDLYDFYYDGNRLSGVGMFDVSGHGISSGLITILAKSVIYRSFTHGEKEKLGKVMEEINDGLIREIGSVDNYLTGILLRFHGRNVEYVNAGHTELLYKRSQSGNVGIVNLENEDIKGRFLGIEGMRGKYQTIQFEMAKDDIVLLYSDCLNESVNAAGKEYGIERISEAMKNSSSQSAQKIRDHIILDFIRFMWPDNAASAARSELLIAEFLGNAASFGLKDDFTLVVVRRNS